MEFFCFLAKGKRGTFLHKRYFIMFVQEHATLSGVCKIKHITPYRLRLWRFVLYLLTLYEREMLRSFCICLMLAIQCHMP